MNTFMKRFRVEDMKEILQNINADILICGHTHLPYHKMIDGKHIINAGSVGKPKDGDPRGNYVIVEIGNEVRMTVVKFTYDVEKAAQAIEEAELPNELAQLLRTGGK